MKIKYEFVTGESIEIEVMDSVAEAAAAIDRDIKNNNRRERRIHSSVEELAEKGIQVADDKVDIHSAVEEQEVRTTLHKALSQLLPQQKDLIQKVFFEGKSISEIARAEGVDESSIRDRLKRIYKKLKNFLN